MNFGPPRMVFDGHAFKSNRREECVQMPAKMGQISPLGRRSGCQDYGRRPRRQAVLSKRGNSAKIDPGLGFIWGIPVQCPTRSPVARDETDYDSVRWSVRSSRIRVRR